MADMKALGDRVRQICFDIHAYHDHGARAEDSRTGRNGKRVCAVLNETRSLLCLCKDNGK